MRSVYLQGGLSYQVSYKFTIIQILLSICVYPTHTNTREGVPTENHWLKYNNRIKKYKDSTTK